MNQWWRYWEGYFSPEDCAKIVEMSMTLPITGGQVGESAATTIADDKVRRSSIRWIPRFDLRFFPLCGNLELLFREGNRHAFGFDLTAFHDLQFTEYHATNEGFYDWHQDTAWASPLLVRRKLSLVVQLSNPADYTGGQLELKEAECGEIPKPEAISSQGTVIVFPSFLRHRVTPVTSGTRYSLVTWIEGPAFR